MNSLIKKPKLFYSDNSLVLTYINPNTPKGGSSVVVNNLLNLFDPKSFKVITTIDRNGSNPVFQTVEYINDIYKYNRYFQMLFWNISIYRDVKKIQDYINKTQPEFILLIYPHLYNILIFLNLDLPVNCKVVSYFHDTFVEGQKQNISEKKLMNYHNRLIKKTDLLLVINEGMKSLYDRKYKLSYSLEHLYPEYDNTDYFISNNVLREKKEKSLFWGGNIVGYSKNSLKRIIGAGVKLDYKIELSSRQSRERINDLIGVTNYNQPYYKKRSDYLNSLKEHSFLLLALDWEFETEYHQDEINTIFSTKAIEYFLSGTPIILHAPLNYFMSKFIQKNECGYVISTLDSDEIVKELENISKCDHTRIIKNAIKIAKKFSKDEILKKWYSYINSI